ncbi:MAG: YdeI/OmpD-associated family protein [Pseudomonadota bacterium]
MSWHDVGSGRYAYTVVWLDPELVPELPLTTFPRLRVAGEINDHPFDASLTPVRGRWYILLSKKLLQAIDCAVGSHVEVRFRIADQDSVNVPDALQSALRADPDRALLWHDLTPGKQRALAHMVASAKTEPTIMKRIQRVFDVLDARRDLKGNLIA